MRIIQSFAEFDDGIFYLQGDKKYGDKMKLNFYSFYLSYLTLQKYYGGVTMFCNQKAYDNLIKYIPYNKVEIFENKYNDFDFWSCYKIEVMKKQTRKFIHVDSDVFIFDDLFREFIDDDSYDLIVQDKVPAQIHPTKSEMPKISSFLKKYEIMDAANNDGKMYSCGVVGMKIKTRNRFVKLADRFIEGFKNNELVINGMTAMISEEHVLYLVAKENKFRVHEILPYDDILGRGSRQTANENKYTHMWGSSKFEPQYVKAIRLKIIKEFPNAISHVAKYENEVMKNTKIVKEIL